MGWDAEWLLTLASGALFLAAFCAVLGAARLYASRRHERAASHRRLRAMHGADAPTRGAGAALRKPKAKGAGARRAFRGRVGRLDQLLAQAGLGPVTSRLLFAGTIAGTAVVVAGAVVLGIRVNGGPGGLAPVPPLVVALPLVLVPLLGVVAPIVFLRRRAARRRQRFVEQLPMALDIMKRVLRAGHPLQGALATVGREMPGPLGAEFAAVANEITYGLDLREAFAHLGRRMAVPELRYLIVAVNVQHETGGNLGAILDRLAQLIRARFRLVKKVRVLSAEARLSAQLLALMPLIFAGLIFLTRPEVYLDIADDPLVLPLVLAAAALQLFGMLVMRRLVRFGA